MFSSSNQIKSISENYSTPVFIYSEAILREQARKVVAFPHAYGFTPRYAMKASSNASILRIFASMGIGIDASSGYEVHRAIAAGIDPHTIQLTGQEIPEDLEDIVNMGVEFNATSLHQLETYGKLFPNSEASIRVNPGVGSGGTKRTNVGGPSSSFGIWHEYLEEAKDMAVKYGLTITKLHTHIGSGADPEVWKNVVHLVLGIAEKLPDVVGVSLGGGFKVARMPNEKSTDIHLVGLHVKALFEDFMKKTGRKLHLEIEPGTFLVANACELLTMVIDVVDTGKEGYNFIKVNAGMTEITRPSLYGAQHPIEVINNSKNEKQYIVIGHNCESGDIFTPAVGDPEGLLPRMLPETKIGDFVVIGGAGAYCSAMSTHGYNSFPEAGEILLREDGEIVEIRKRAKKDEVWRNELRIL